jgi:hypothetical protein
MISDFRETGRAARSIPRPLGRGGRAQFDLAKGAEALAKTAGDKIGGLIGDLCQSVAYKFKGDSYAEQTLARAKEKPDSKATLGVLQEVLAEKMEKDADFAEKIQKLVDALEKGSPRAAFDQRGQTIHGSLTSRTK